MIMETKTRNWTPKFIALAVICLLVGAGIGLVSYHYFLKPQSAVYEALTQGNTSTNWQSTKVEPTKEMVEEIVLLGNGKKEPIDPKSEEGTEIASLLTRKLHELNLQAKCAFSKEEIQEIEQKDRSIRLFFKKPIDITISQWVESEDRYHISTDKNGYRILENVGTALFIIDNLDEGLEAHVLIDHKIKGRIGYSCWAIKKEGSQEIEKNWIAEIYRITPNNTGLSANDIDEIIYYKQGEEITYNATKLPELGIDLLLTLQSINLQTPRGIFRQEDIQEIKENDRVIEMGFRHPEDVTISKRIGNRYYRTLGNVKRALFILEDNLDEGLEGHILVGYLVPPPPGVTVSREEMKIAYSCWAINLNPPEEEVKLDKSWIDEIDELLLEEEQETNSQSQLYMNYHFTAEAAYQDIKISQSKLIYTYFEDVEGKCEGWVAQTPCWAGEDLTTKETTLSEKEINELVSLIDQTNFMKLENTYGGATHGQKYYPERLSVRIGEKEKEVIYQSSWASPMPEAFKKVKDKLFELVDVKFQKPVISVSSSVFEGGKEMTIYNDGRVTSREYHIYPSSKRIIIREGNISEGEINALLNLFSNLTEYKYTVTLTENIKHLFEPFGNAEISCIPLNKTLSLGLRPPSFPEPETATITAKEIMERIDRIYREAEVSERRKEINSYLISLNLEPYAPSYQPNQMVTFNASLRLIPELKRILYEWDFGDGSKKGYGKIVRHSYSSPGNYTVRLKITSEDAEGIKDETVAIRSTPAPVIWIEKKVNPEIEHGAATTGGKVAVTIKVENRRDEEIFDVDVKDEFPEGKFKLVSGDTSMYLRALKPGESKILKYELRALEAGYSVLKPATLTYKDESGVQYSNKSNIAEVMVRVPPPGPPSAAGFIGAVAVIAFISIILILEAVQQLPNNQQIIFPAQI